MNGIDKIPYTQKTCWNIFQHQYHIFLWFLKHVNLTPAHTDSHTSPPIRTSPDNPTPAPTFRFCKKIDNTCGKPSIQDPNIVVNVSGKTRNNDEFLCLPVKVILNVQHLMQIHDNILSELLIFVMKCVNNPTPPPT